MRKAAVQHGDPTTTGGFVRAFSSTIHDDGKKVALSGEEATCGNCKGAYKIYGTGEGMTERGRNVVLDGDQVMCPCGKNRVIVGSRPGIFIETTQGSAVASSVSNSYASPLNRQHDEQFTLRDGETRRPLANVRYRIRTASGAISEGITNAEGKTIRVQTDGAESLTIEVLH